LKAADVDASAIDPRIDPQPKRLLSETMARPGIADHSREEIDYEKRNQHGA
jgi:hypothetical protein